jgi:hypothetical protein
MPRTVPLDYLLITAASTLDLAMLADALAPLRLGLVTVVPPVEDPVAARLAGRPRVALGRIGIRETLGRCEATLVVEHHARPVMQGLAPESLARLLNGLDAEAQPILRAGTISIDTHITVIEPDPQWALRWAGVCLERLGTACGAVIFDPAAQRCQSPAQVSRERDQGAIAQITLHNEVWGPEERWLHTHGLQKFGQPELEIVGVPQSLVREGTSMLRIIAENLAASELGEAPALRAGMQVECEGAGLLLARKAPSDHDHQAPFGRLRLVTTPAPGAPAGQDATATLCAAALHAANAALAARDQTSAEAILDRVLAAVPDDPAAVTLKARALLAHAQPQRALELGEFLAARRPDDARGPYVTGLALLALGRFAEALGALSRAVTLDPDDPAPFEARARLFERLGRPHDAAADLARARMLHA